MQINDLRDPRVLAVEPASIKSIAMTRGTNKLALQNNGQGWQLTEPVNMPADDAAVNRFLDDLTGTRAKRFVADVTTELQQFGLTTPTAIVTLTGTGTNVLAQLLIGSVDASNEVRFVKRADEPFIYGVETNALDQSPSALAETLAKKPVATPATTNTPPNGTP